MGRRRKGKRRVGVDDEVKSQSTDDSRPRSREDQSTARSNNSASTYTATFTNDDYETAFSHAPRLYLAPEITKVNIGKIPIMVQSPYCILSDIPKR